MVNFTALLSGQLALRLVYRIEHRSTQFILVVTDRVKEPRLSVLDGPHIVPEHGVYPALVLRDLSVEILRQGRAVRADALRAHADAHALRGHRQRDRPRDALAQVLPIAVTPARRRARRIGYDIDPQHRSSQIVDHWPSGTADVAAQLAPQLATTLRLQIAYECAPLDAAR